MKKLVLIVAATLVATLAFADDWMGPGTELKTVPVEYQGTWYAQYAFIPSMRDDIVPMNGAFHMVIGANTLTNGDGQVTTFTQIVQGIDDEGKPMVVCVYRSSSDEVIGEMFKRTPQGNGLIIESMVGDKLLTRLIMTREQHPFGHD